MSTITLTKEKLPVYLISILLVYISGCGLLDSDGSIPIIPGARNYEWKVDTLYNGPGVFYDIWGSRPDDVWAVSDGGLHHLWHYDGIDWAPFEGSKVIFAETVHGFSQDNVWIGGGGGRIYHYDGNSWELNYQFNNPGEGSSRITDIWGDSPTNLYAIGYFYMERGGSGIRSFILKYDGGRWDTWNELLTTDFEVYLGRIRMQNGTPFIRGTKQSFSTAPDTLLIYQYSNNALYERIVKLSNQVRALWLNDIGNFTGFIIDDQLTVLENGQFIPILSLDDYDTLVGVFGRHEKDIFISTWSQVFHYNGEDKVLLLDDLPRIVSQGQLFTEDVFFLIRNYNEGTTLIYHGTLTDNE